MLGEPEGGRALRGHNYTQLCLRTRKKRERGVVFVFNGQDRNHTRYKSGVSVPEVPYAQLYVTIDLRHYALHRYIANKNKFEGKKARQLRVAAYTLRMQL